MVLFFVFSTCKINVDTDQNNFIFDEFQGFFR